LLLRELGSIAEIGYRETRQEGISSGSTRQAAKRPHTNLDFATITQQNVIGFDIAVNAMHLVNVNESLESLAKGSQPRMRAFRERAHVPPCSTRQFELRPSSQSRIDPKRLSGTRRP
jgi:hypothetical protein